MDRAATLTDHDPMPFVQIFNLPLREGSTWSLKKIVSGLLEKFKGVDGRLTRCDYNSSSWAFSSAELKTKHITDLSIKKQKMYSFLLWMWNDKEN